MMLCSNFVSQVIRQFRNIELNDLAHSFTTAGRLTGQQPAATRFPDSILLACLFWTA